HTRSKRDWSSDVCSSDLEGESFDGTAVRLAAWFHCAVFDPTESENNDKSAVFTERTLDPAAPVEEVARLVRLMGGHRAEPGDLRSEERRVGKEGIVRSAR